MTLQEKLYLENKNYTDSKNKKTEKSEKKVVKESKTTKTRKKVKEDFDHLEYHDKLTNRRIPYIYDPDLGEKINRVMDKYCIYNIVYDLEENRDSPGVMTLTFDNKPDAKEAFNCLRDHFRCGLDLSRRKGPYIIDVVGDHNSKPVEESSRKKVKESEDNFEYDDDYDEGDPADNYDEGGPFDDYDYSDDADSVEDIFDKYDDGSLHGLEYAVDDAIQDFSVTMDEEGILPWDDEKGKFKCSNEEILSKFREYNNRWNASWLEDDYGLSESEAEIIYDYMRDQIIKYYGNYKMTESKKSRRRK